MDQDEEDWQIAEAIRLSLLESGQQPAESTHSVTGSQHSPPLLPSELNNTRRPLPPPPPPSFFIADFSDDDSDTDRDKDNDVIPLSGYSTRSEGLGDLATHRKHAKDDSDGSDEEEKQLKLALEMSLLESGTPSNTGSGSTSSSGGQDAKVHSAALSPVDVPTISVLAGMSRAEMERERQERLNARKRANTQEETQNSTTTVHEDRATKRHASDMTSIVSEMTERSFPSSGLSTRPKRARLPSFSPSPPPAPASAPAPPSPPMSMSTGFRFAQSKPSMGNTTDTTTRMKNPQPHEQETARLQQLADLYPIQYTEATFKNTYIQGTVKGPNTVRIDDLIDREFIQKAVMTSFQLDSFWLEKYLPRTVPQLLVTHWSSKMGESPGFRTTGKVTELHPPLTGYGSFHPKLMLLFYASFCRVVIGSANLVPHDWSEMVNTLYVQDFPMLPTRVSNPTELGSFGSTLYNFLEVMTIPTKILRVVECIDFSSAKVHLIPTVQGSHPVFADHAYGIARFAKVMEAVNPRRQPWMMEYQTSSIGRLTLKFLTEFDNAARGLPVRTRSRLDPEELMPPIKIIFPTERTVQESRNGEMGAGTICFQEHFWKEPSFPKPVLHDFECVAGMKGSLMHSKVCLARPRPNAADIVGVTTTQSGNSSTSAASTSNVAPAGWFYVGSANFTESAWGTISQKKKAGKKPSYVEITSDSVPTPASELGLMISMRNWELGVIHVMDHPHDMEALQQKRSAKDRSEGINFFGPLAVPFKRPVRQYTSRDKPWFMVG
ncbi:hypothetical protein BGZ94_006512 [Podila epigama]|nr:hypothetical protein BGZ94_006512 [Podila epigama]